MSNPQNIPPPKWPLKLLRLSLRDEYLEEIEGDMEEVYHEYRQNHSKHKADLKYLSETLKLMRTSLIKKIEGTQKLNHFGMFKHNFILSIRNFKRYTSTFLINLTGLSTGLACVLFIYLWISDELSIDQFHQHGDQLYQIRSNQSDASGIFTWKGVPGLLLEEIQATVPEVEKSVTMTDAHEYTLSNDQTSIKGYGKFISSEFFDVFTFPFLKGNPSTALADKASIIITESMAQRLFQSTDVIGRNIVWHFWGRKKNLEITGVIQNIPKTTSEPFDFLMSWDYYHDDLITYKNWYNYYARIVVLLKDNASATEATIKIDGILKEKQQSDRVDLFLTNYAGQYLFNKYVNGQQAGGRIEYVRLFGVIAIFILFIACINFINLSTARAAQRTKEIGVKKSIGASRWSLMNQFFMESVLLSLFSMIVAILMVLLLLPQFNYLAQKQLTFTVDLQLVYAVMGITAAVGLLAGCYPALYLSGIDALRVLTGKISKKSGEIWGRKSLVIMQFTLSVVLIMAVLIVYKQMDFVKNKNLGYDRDNLVYFEREGELINNHEAFLGELKNISGVEKATVSGFMVGGGNSTGGVSWKGKTDEDQIQFWETRSGYGTLDIMNIELIEGRDFSKNYGSDTASIIFNETAIKAMGMTDPIGKTIWHYDGNKKIIGVVKDFNLVSLHTKVEPALFLFAPERTHFIMVKIKGGNESQTLSNIESLYQTFNPGFPFKPVFVDQDYQALYASEERIASLSSYFAGLAILISCLGLFGLASYTTERRIKEIGIRKTLGSGIWRIVVLLTKDFTKLVLMALLIALPSSYYIGSEWLKNFAYRIDISWWFFALSGVLAMAIAWFTVAWQTIKAARINPADCLKDE